jgi:RNA polymerase sigma-70 factor (ECF subfamily)
VLSKVLAHIQGFEYRGEGSFRRWLAALVVNECRSELEARAGLTTETRELTEVADVAGAASEELSAERKALLEQLGELDPFDRDLLIMRYFERMSWDAIAEALECSIEKTKSDFALAFQRLSRRLGA